MHADPVTAVQDQSHAAREKRTSTKAMRHAVSDARVRPLEFRLPFDFRSV
jgi:hypothetical protein